MNEESGANVIRLEAAQKALRQHFLGWQCRLRQLSVREDEGRPSAGMSPFILKQGEDATEQSPRITVLIVQTFPSDSTAEFRHMVRKTHDPRERFKQALKLLQSVYYQYPEDFNDEMTALFAQGSGYAAELMRVRRCDLFFQQYNQSYRLPCRVRKLIEPDPAYQATFWHNSLFNATLPAKPIILAFQPEWADAVADPPAV
ncbi:MAG: hypothetical protein AAF530_15995 [Pseudomonadota bacterium]